MLERHLRGELFRSVSELRVFQGGGRIRAWTHTAVGGGNLCRDQSAPRRDTVGKKPRRIALELLTLGACKTSVNWFLGANYFSERNFEKLKGGFPAGNGAPPPADPSWHPQSAAPLWGGRGAGRLAPGLTAAHVRLFPSCSLIALRELFKGRVWPTGGHEVI